MPPPPPGYTCGGGWYAGGEAGRGFLDGSSDASGFVLKI